MYDYYVVIYSNKENGHKVDDRYVQSLADGLSYIREYKRQYGSDCVGSIRNRRTGEWEYWKGEYNS